VVIGYIFPGLVLWTKKNLATLDTATVFSDKTEPTRQHGGGL
jgi:hypothetical protein